MCFIRYHASKVVVWNGRFQNLEQISNTYRVDDSEIDLLSGCISAVFNGPALFSSAVLSKEMNRGEQGNAKNDPQNAHGRPPLKIGCGAVKGWRWDERRSTHSASRTEHPEHNNDIRQRIPFTPQFTLPSDLHRTFPSVGTAEGRSCLRYAGRHSWWRLSGSLPRCERKTYPPACRTGRWWRLGGRAIPKVAPTCPFTAPEGERRPVRDSFSLYRTRSREQSLRRLVFMRQGWRAPKPPLRECGS